MEKADISGKTKALGAQLEAGTIDQAGYQEGLKAINQGGRNFFQRVGAGLGGEIKGNYNKSNG